MNGNTLDQLHTKYYLAEIQTIPRGVIMKVNRHIRSMYAGGIFVDVLTYNIKLETLIKLGNAVFEVITFDFAENNVTLVKLKER
ncbi:hypothetical protein D3C80_2016160 [compost metagenome]